MDIPYKEHAIPICYRCDSKYRYFLLNSIKSILTYYRGEQSLFFYICTTEQNFNLTELDTLKEKYNFEYYIAVIDDNLSCQIPKKFKSFISIENIEKSIPQLTKKVFIDLKEEFFSQVNTEYNKTSYIYNPFGRSKFITACWFLFFPFLTDHYDKIITLDTDTIVVSNIKELFDIDINNVSIAFCSDWVNPSSVNASNGLINIRKILQTYFKKDGLFEAFSNLIIKPQESESVFSEEVQMLVYRFFRNDHLLLDKAWNVPITHKHLNPIPKIYHFSESWTGKKHILTSYEEIIDKYLNGN